MGRKSVASQAFEDAIAGEASAAVEDLGSPPVQGRCHSGLGTPLEDFGKRVQGARLE